MTTTVTTTAAPSSNSKKRKKGRNAPLSLSLSSLKNLLIRAGRGIALDKGDAQATFLGTLYSHHSKLSLSESGNGNHDDDDEDKGGRGDTRLSSPEKFSFAPHLYAPSALLDEKTQKLQPLVLLQAVRSPRTCSQGAAKVGVEMRNWGRRT